MKARYFLLIVLIVVLLLVFWQKETNVFEALIIPVAVGVLVILLAAVLNIRQSQESQERPKHGWDQSVSTALWNFMSLEPKYTWANGNQKVTIVSQKRTMNPRTRELVVDIVSEEWAHGGSVGQPQPLERHRLLINKSGEIEDRERIA